MYTEFRLAKTNSDRRVVHLVQVLRCPRFARSPPAAPSAPRRRSPSPTVAPSDPTIRTPSSASPARSMSTDAAATLPSCTVAAATAQPILDVHLQSPSSTSERTPSGDVRADPGCIPEFSIRCSLALSIDTVGIEFKRSKCRRCAGTADVCPCPPSPRACAACCSVACSDIPDCAPDIDPLANDPAFAPHSSADPGDGGGDPDGDSGGLSGGGYCACPTSVDLGDEFCDATHPAPEWAELEYPDKWLRP